MVQFITIICTIFLIGQIAFADANGFPETLTLQIINDHETIILNWKKTEQFVANNNLPIWSAWRNREPELIPNLMDDIGPFVMYHDVEKSSAVVLFEYQQRIFGIVDTRFYITALPLSEVGVNFYHGVGGRYIKLRADENFHDRFYDFPIITADDRAYLDSFIPGDPPSETLSTHESSPQPNLDVRDIYSVIQPQAGPSNEHQVGRTLHQVDDTLYAEILVFITNDVVQHFTKKDPDLKLLVAYYLIHFNAIDMLYAKLRNDVKIHINIAGLVLESQIMTFPYIFTPSDERPSRILDGRETLKRFPEYIKRYNVFTRDSFDFFYVSTHYRIESEGVKRLGLSNSVDNYSNRKESGVQYVASGVLVERKPLHSDFITFAHELAHQMNVKHDPSTAGKSCGGKQCFAMLQDGGTFCRNCIRWSEKSINEFKTYASTDKERCFLLNSPRSLHPYGTLITTIAPSRQCTCYGYQSHYSGSHLDEVMSHRCNAKLACANNNRPVHHANPKPFDGTPCGLQKVCWREECQSLEMPPFVLQQN